MSEAIIPAPSAPPVPVETGISTKVVTDADAALAISREGGIKIEAETVRDLATIGIFVRGTGVLLEARGRATMTQRSVARVMAKIVDVVENGGVDKKDPTKKVPLSPNAIFTAAKAIAAVSAAISESQRVMLDVEKYSSSALGPSEAGVVGSQSPNFGRPAPPPSGTVVVAQEVHMHAPAPLPDKPAST